MGSVSGSYGTLVAAIDRTADGLVTRIQYGDAANTTTANDYDDRRRLRHTMTYPRLQSSMNSRGESYKVTATRESTRTSRAPTLHGEPDAWITVEDDSPKPCKVVTPKRP